MAVTHILENLVSLRKMHYLQRKSKNKTEQVKQLGLLEQRLALDKHNSEAIIIEISN